MDESGKFLLPAPVFKKVETSSSTAPHFLSPKGIQLLPKEQQPPPMYGPRGSTVPPKFLSPLKVPSTSNSFDRKQKYFCEPCEAEFHTSTDYKVHKSEHIQCEIDNCTFHGHPAFMDTHIGLQHGKGLYDQIKKLSTPEEIAQWRADRKKNYPTVAIVEQKWKARQQRQIRGEKLELENKKRFGKKSDRRPMRGDKSRENADSPGSNRRMVNKTTNKKQSGKKFEKKKAPPSQKTESSLDEKVEDADSCDVLQMFKGTGGMSDYKKVKKIEVNVLSSLLGMYGSDSDSEDNSEESSENEEASKINNGIIADHKQPGKDEPSNVLEDTMPEAHILESEPKSSVESEKLASHMEEIPIEPKNQEKTEESTLQMEEPEHQVETDKSTSPIEEVPFEGNAKNMEGTSDDEAPEEVAINRTTNIPDRPQPESLRTKLASHLEDVSIEPKIQMETENSTSTMGEVPIENSAKVTEAQPSDDEAPEEVAISKSTNIPDIPQLEPPHKKFKPNPKIRKSGLDYRKLRVSRQNTMLEKLLEPDIRHERNVLLQCVRFVVENNFFDKPKSSQS